jgi:signal transduction histidine kinase
MTEIDAGDNHRRQSFSNCSSAEKSTMSHSIRWRLIGSYLLLALLAVIMADLLAIWGVRQYAANQETSYLTSYADEIALQAMPLLKSVPKYTRLRQLVQAASFFGNLQVRIYDSNQNIIADSEQPDQSLEKAWLILPDINIGTPLGGSSVSPERAIEQQHDHPTPGPQVPPKTQPSVPSQNEPMAMIHRVYGPWGSRFSLGALPDSSSNSSATAKTHPGDQLRSEKVVTAPIGNPQAPSGYVKLSSGTDFAALAFQATWPALLLAGLGAIILAALLGQWMGRHLSQPIIDLTATTCAMSAGNLSARARVTGQDEISDLATAFNAMADRLQNSIFQLQSERDALHHFIAEASHELRTPITAIKNFLALLQGPAADDSQARIEFLAESQVQIDRLVWITNNLLDLSRLEAGLSPLELSMQNACDLLECAVAPLKMRADEKKLALRLQLPTTPIFVVCDPERIEIAISNLLENAIKYTPPNGEILLGIARSGNQVQIWVANNGSNIHTQDLPHIFERSFRGRNQTIEGSGLGLAIVQSIIQAHGWQVIAENLHPNGVQFTVLCSSPERK